MSTIRRAFVLSDLHLGPDNPLSTFRDEIPLAALLDSFAQEAPFELVLAGDLFDFLQVDGYEGFAPERSVERFEAILKAPRTSAVVAALKRLAQRPGVEISLLVGNHDPELLLPDVQGRFERAIGRQGSVRYADDTPLVPDDGTHPGVWGRVLGPPGDPERSVWVIHGDRWDPVNMIDRDGLREALRQGREVRLPTGSHVVFEILQKIKPKRPWIDHLKPEPAVFLLLLYLDFRTTSHFLTKHYGLTGRLLRDQVRAKVRSGPLFGEAAVTDPNRSTALASLLARGLQGSSTTEQQLLLAALESAFNGVASPAPGTLAAHGGLPRWLLRAWLTNLRAAARSEPLDASDGIPEAAAPYLPEGLAALVVGHTHAPRALPGRRPAYFNSGTWLPVGEIPEGEIADLIDQLEGGASWPAESPRTYMRIDLEDSGPSVRLFSCDAAGRPKEPKSA